MNNTDNKDSTDNVDSTDNKYNILRDMLSFINIEFTDINTLIGTEIDRDVFLMPFVIDKFKNYQNDLKKKGYKSSYLTSLQKNNIVKQQFPAINTMRQILKCNDLKLKPKNQSLGYNKSTGSKIIKRSFIITPLSVENL
uniref:Uncharacterized protein n=1 Tax=viral metagenome TaxID=1070528 RepID=A0A6C0JET7_9ZZZZ